MEKTIQKFKAPIKKTALYLALLLGEILYILNADSPAGMEDPGGMIWVYIGLMFLTVGLAIPAVAGSLMVAMMQPRKN